MLEFGRDYSASRSSFDVLRIALTLAAALGLGLCATYFSLARPFGAIQAGVWTVSPRIGSTGINPYERAAVARNGEIPLGLSEGLMFIARTDQSGAPLSGKCVYLVGDAVPTARFWTLTPVLPNGGLIENRAKRYGFSSTEIVRRADGKFEIVVSRAAVPGNWLPLGDTDRFELMLRIYDTTLGATAATLDKTLMPSVVRESCR